jgi:hypothetical protein
MTGKIITNPQPLDRQRILDLEALSLPYSRRIELSTANAATNTFSTLSSSSSSNFPSLFSSREVNHLDQGRGEGMNEEVNESKDVPGAGDEGQSDTTEVTEGTDGSTERRVLTAVESDQNRNERQVVDAESHDPSMTASDETQVVDAESHDQLMTPSEQIPVVTTGSRKCTCKAITDYFFDCLFARHKHKES